MDSTKERCRAFLLETGVSKAAFCRNVNISVSALKQWLAGSLRLCSATEQQIDRYLRSFNR